MMQFLEAMGGREKCEGGGHISVDSKWKEVQHHMVPGRWEGRNNLKGFPLVTSISQWKNRPGYLLTVRNLGLKYTGK